MKDRGKGHAQSQRDFRSIAGEAQRILDRALAKQATIRALMEAESERHLTADEVDRLRDLRRELEVMRRRLAALREELGRPRAQPPD